jgi:hypothetical protein
VIRQRDFLARNRHRIALLAVLGTISLAVVAEHSGLGHGELMDDGMGDVVSMCLAIVDAGVALLFGGVALFALPRRFAVAPRELGSRSVVLPVAPVALPPRVRAGPPLLQVFRR